MTVWNIFQDLDRSRTFTGMGSPAPIQTSEILAMFDLYGVRGRDREEYHRIIRALDGARLEHLYKRAEEERDANSRSSDRRERGGPRG